MRFYRNPFKVVAIILLITATVLFSFMYQGFDVSAGQFRLTQSVQQKQQDTVQQHVQQNTQQQVLNVQENKISTKTYFYGSSLLASKSDNIVTYYHDDYLGSVRLQSDAGAKKPFSSRTAPFGSDVFVSGYSLGTENAYKFTGQEQDDGLYYYGARYYDTKTGRFTQLDPVLSAESPYAYVSNNPLKFSDPTGMQTNAVIFYLSPSIDSGGNFEKTALYRKELYMKEYGWSADEVMTVPVNDWWWDYDTWFNTLKTIGERGDTLKIIEALGHSGGLDIGGMEGNSLGRLHDELSEAGANPIGPDTQAFFLGCHSGGYLCGEGTELDEYEDSSFAERFAGTFGITASGSTTGISFYGGKAGRFHNALASLPTGVLVLGPGDKKGTTWLPREMPWITYRGDYAKAIFAQRSTKIEIPVTPSYTFRYTIEPRYRLTITVMKPSKDVYMTNPWMP